MKTLFRWIAALALSLPFQVSADDQPAFPGAEGYGMYTTGGRGGKVYHVTSLSDDGSAGTLRHAVNQSGPRTIVFDVSGIIELQKRLSITNDDITIAGQTAPGDGICIKNYDLYVNANNVIIRFMRFRMGTDAPDEIGSDGKPSIDRDASWGRRKKNIILDHCSMSWCTDECASFYDNENFTMQWCLVAESLRGSFHPKGYHGYGGIWGGRGATFHHNLVAHHDSRTPRLCGSRYSNLADQERVDLRNNVFYNWGSTNSGYAGEGGSYNFINNYYKAGPATKSSIQYRIFQPWADDGKNSQAQGVYGHFYISGNYMEGKGDNWDWNGIDIDNSNNGQMNQQSIRSYTEYSVAPVTTQSAKEAYQKVLQWAGASYKRDAVDARICEETRNGSYTYTGSVLKGKGIIDSPSDVGGWPTYASAPAQTDSDGDGIPDSWEERKGLDKNDPSDGSAIAPSGYTYLEVYMNSIVNEVMGISSDEEEEVINTVTKAPFDFVVGVDGNFAEAKRAAEASQSERFIIFFPDGEYNIGSLTGDGNQMTTWTKSSVSFIGQSMDNVILYNTCSQEAIGTTATLYLSKANNMYLQDITLQNRSYNNPNASANRFVALMDQGSKNTYKFVKLLSTQDTYYSKSDRTYAEDCEIHGTVDFICGSGDIFFNRCLLYLENRQNNCITAPATTTSWGYVFKDCTIDGYASCNGNYRLGRSWNKSPRCVYINTKMNIQPTAAGWGDPMNVVPALFAEYNSVDGNGNPINLSNRRSSYTKDNQTVYINPVLSASEATKYTIANVVGGNDNWQPDQLAQQVQTPKVSVNNGVISWSDNPSARCYAIFKNNVYVGNTTGTQYTIPAGTSSTDEFTIRAANSMGGLSSVSNAVTSDGGSFSTTESFIFHYDNGSLSQDNGHTGDNHWTCTTSGATDYSWAITGRTDKSILNGQNITYQGRTYTTYKNSNGATNTFYLPKNKKAKKITLIGYSNDESTAGYLTEINGKEVSYPFNAKVSDSNFQNNPTIVSYTFEDEVCDQFTFTFSTKQICFIIALETEDCECNNSSVDCMLITNDKENNPHPIYDIYGRIVTTPINGHIYIQNGNKRIQVEK